jgi:hypothetical protein
MKTSMDNAPGRAMRPTRVDPKHSADSSLLKDNNIQLF